MKCRITSYNVCYTKLLRFLPVVQSVFYSFFNFKLTRKKMPLVWNNFDNYKSLWESGKLQNAFAITFQFMILVVVSYNFV